MPNVIRPSGVLVTLPPGLAISPEVSVAAGRKRRGRRAAATGRPPRDDESAALIAALEEQDFKVVDEIPVVARRAPRGRRSAGHAAAGQEVKFGVKLEAGEDAVVLVEQDGEYRWQIPEQPAVAPATRGRRGAKRATGARFITFSIKVEPSPDVPMPARRRRGGVTSLVWGAVRGYVLKFAARLAGKALMKHLERDIQTGLVQLKSADDPEAWRRLGPSDSVRLRSAERPRVLLFVHGTFSSTVGSFGALADTEPGRRLLETALRNYDAVIGFDHRTLSEDPRENAKAMRDRLRKLDWPADVVFDAVCFSRGGLVFRTFVEELLAGGRWRPHVDRVVFVGCTNEGTQLAKPENWHRLVDLYTNLAAGACRALGLVPSAAPFATIFGEIIKSVGALVKGLATYAIDEGGAPGLAAMDPDGRFVKELNKAQHAQPSVEDSYYCAITTDFEAKLALGDVARSGLPPKLLAKLVDGLVDQLMGVRNDLVVHLDSMTGIDRASGDFIKERFDFGENGTVYHTNYFSQPDTIGALASWLRLGAPQAMAVGARSRSGSRRVPLKRASVDRWTAPTIGAGGAVVSTPSSGATTNPLITDATASIRDLSAAVAHREADFVVVRRKMGRETGHYAITAGEVRTAAREMKPQETLTKALDLHEHTMSQVRELDDAHELTPMAASEDDDPTKNRMVVLNHGAPVGVIPASTELLDYIDLAEAPAASTRGVGSRRAATTGGGKRGGGGGGSRRAGARRKAVKRGRAKPSLIGTAGPGGGTGMGYGSGAGRIAGSVRAANGGGGGGKAPREATVECYFQAEIDEEVVVKRSTTVDVSVSREAIEAGVDRLSTRARARGVKKDQLIEIEVVPKQNFALPKPKRGSKDRGDLRQIPVPKPGVVERLSFTLTPAARGDGEVWVQARQGRLPLVTLKLSTRILAEASTTRPRKSRAAVNVANMPAPRAPVDTLRITEQPSNGTVRYDFDVELTSVKPPRRLRKASAPLVIDREKYIGTIYGLIEERWSHDKDSFDAFKRDLESIGARMFRELVPREVQELLWENRPRIKHIQILSTEPFIPWELVYVTNPAERARSPNGRFLGEMGLVRWLWEDFAPEELRVRRGHARYVAPEYPLEEDQLVAMEDETKLLQAMFGATPVEAKAAVVYKLLESPGQFDLLHFVCHGMADSTQIEAAGLKMAGAIVDGEYKEEYVYAGTVETDGKLRPDHGSRPIVVLNACQSARAGYTLNGIGGFAQAFVRAGVGAFVGTHWSVGDGEALTFVKQFYRGLIKQKLTLAEAVITARNSAKNAGDATWLAYVAYGEPFAKVVPR